MSLSLEEKLEFKRGEDILELSGLLVGKQGLSLKQQGKIYQYCVRPLFFVLL